MLPRVPTTILSNFEGLVANSQSFPIPFPTVRNRITALVGRSPNPRDVEAQIFDDAVNTRVIVHRRVIGLIKDFLRVKINFGSPVERALYMNMTVSSFIQRLILKRPLSFVGPDDETIGRDGQPVPNASNKWRLVGTEEEEEPLLLKHYLSYDEIAIGALIGVSSPTYFINSGARANMAKIGTKGKYTERGVYVGLVGARFEIPDEMESRFLIASTLCSTERGYGFYNPPTTHDQAILRIWAKFYNLRDTDTGKWGFPIYLETSKPILNIDYYKDRIGLTIETFLLEADGRGQEADKNVHAFVVGLGLGVWKYSEQQNIAYLEVLVATIERITLLHVQVVEVSWIMDAYNGTDRLVVLSGAGNHITILLTKGNPADKREDDRLLVACYAWDGNAFPGNDIWRGHLRGSGDPAAVCCSTIGELQNPYVNPFHKNIHVVPFEMREPRKSVEVRDQ